MSSKSKRSKMGHETKGPFGGLRGKIKKAQVRYLATRQAQAKDGTRK